MELWGVRVKDLRAKMDWSQVRLAEKIGCSYQLIRQWEIRATPPGGEYQKRFEELEAGLNAADNAG